MGDDDYYYDDDPYDDYDYEVEETWETPLQNKYSDAKAVIDSNPAESIQKLKEVISEDPHRGLWTFKCLKKLARASRVAKNYPDMIKYYKEVIAFESEDVDTRMRVHAMVKFIGRIHLVPPEVQQEAIDITLATAAANLDDYGDLWLNTMLRKATALADEGAYEDAMGVLHRADAWCYPDHLQGNEAALCTIRALLVRCGVQAGRFPEARTAYLLAVDMSSSRGPPIPARVLANVAEWGGHVFLRDGDWHAAHRAFRTAFQLYGTMGDGRAQEALKFSVIADMICGSPVDTFAATETKASANAAVLLPIVSLLKAFLACDVAGALAVLHAQEHRVTFVDDALLAPYVEPLLFRLRLNALVKLVASFRTVGLAAIAERVCLPGAVEAGELCTFAILHHLITAAVDDTTGMLHVYDTKPSSALRRAEALHRWSTAYSTA